MIREGPRSGLPSAFSYPGSANVEKPPSLRHTSGLSYLVVRGLVGIGILHFRIRSVLPLFSCVKVLRARCTSKCNNIYFLHEGVEAEKAVGVVSFGPGIEGNPLVAGLMGAVGQGAGLLAAKGGAIALGIALHVCQVHAAVAVLAAFYVVAAVLPWMAILFS